MDINRMMRAFPAHLPTVENHECSDNATGLVRHEQ